MMSDRPTGKRKFVPSISNTNSSVRTDHSLKSSLENAAVVRTSDSELKIGPTEQQRPDEKQNADLLLSESIVSALDRSMSNAGQTEWSRSVNSSFRNVLYQYVRDDVRANDMDVIFSNEIATLIVDAYPKAAIHLLLLPKESYFSIREIRDLHSNNIEKIVQFHKLANEIADVIQRGDQSFDLISSKWHMKLRNMYMWRQPLRCGYHIIPSLYPLHLHIISNDLISPTLKNKGHWNKFTTEYFISTEEVESILNTKVQDGLLRIAVPKDDYYETVLKKPLTCHHCGEIFPTMPKLKWHIEACMLSDT